MRLTRRALAALPLALVAPARAALPDGVPVVAVVKVPTPWYAPRFLVVSRMRDTIPTYDRLPGLAYKVFTIADTGEFGGIYLWRDAAAARAWYTLAWFRRVEETRGAPADLRLFAAPAWFDTQPGGTPAAEDPAMAMTLHFADQRPQPAQDRATPGLLRRYALVDETGRDGAASLWRDRAAAQAALGGAAGVEWFAAPLLLPSADPANQLQMSAP